jgi:hypothetical protein
MLSSALSASSITFSAADATIARLLDDLQYPGDNCITDLVALTRYIQNGRLAYWKFNTDASEVRELRTGCYRRLAQMSMSHLRHPDDLCDADVDLFEFDVVAGWLSYAEIGVDAKTVQKRRTACYRYLAQRDLNNLRRLDNKCGTYAVQLYADAKKGRLLLRDLPVRKETLRALIQACQDARARPAPKKEHVETVSL